MGDPFGFDYDGQVSKEEEEDAFLLFIDDDDDEEDEGGSQISRRLPTALMIVGVTTAISVFLFLV